MKILSIFNRYRQYGGEETVMKKIDDLLREHSASRSFVYSTSELLGHSWLGKIQAPFKSLDNRNAAKQLEQIQREHSYGAWLIHNVFPALSPSVFSTAFKLNVPVIFMAHNYRLGCINGSMLRNGRHCQLCMEKSVFRGISNRCWHHSYLLSAYSTLFQALTKRTGFFNKTAAFIAVSNAQVKWLGQIGFPRDKIHVIPHFVNSPGEATLPASNGNVLFMGRLSREKGVDLLLKSWLELSPAGRRLVIAGTGPEEEALKQFARDHQMDNVDFAGFVPESKHRELWNNAAFYIMPSIWEETAAMTILEGWSYGRPALAYNIGAASDYLNDPDAGWLAEIEGSPGLTETLAQALATPEQLLHRMSRHVRQKAAGEYGPASWLESFNALYQQIAHH